MTGTEILNTIHIIYEQDTTLPETTSEDYQIRLTYLNQAILTWQNEVFNGALWQELYKSVTQSIAIVSIPDFLYPEKLYIGFTEYKFVLPYQSNDYIINSSQDFIYWITGGSNNKVLNVYPTIVGVGNYTLAYYKQATLYTSLNIGTDIEMANPNFVIQYVLSQLYASDGDQTMSNSSMQMAQRYLEQMKNGLDTMPYGSFSNIADDNIGFGV